MSLRATWRKTPDCGPTRQLASRPAAEFGATKTCLDQRSILVGKAPIPIREPGPFVFGSHQNSAYYQALARMLPESIPNKEGTLR